MAAVDLRVILALSVSRTFEVRSWGLAP